MNKLKRRDSFDERYKSLLSDLQTQLRAGILRPGDPIQPENWLAEQYNMSRSSVRKALNSLVEAGIIEKIPGKGNYIRRVDPLFSHESALNICMYTPFYDRGAVVAIFDAFRKTYPNISLHIHELSAQTYIHDLQAMLRGEYPPDLFFVTDIHLATSQIADEMLDIADWLPKGFDVASESYAPVWEPYRSGDAVIGFPMSYSPVILAYNLDMFDTFGLSYPDPNTPLTWSQIRSLAARLTVLEKDKRTYGFGISTSITRFSSLLMAYGFRVSSGEEPDWNSPALLQALGLTYEMLYVDRVSPIYSASEALMVDEMFNLGHTAMVLTTLITMSQQRKNHFRWDIAHPPTGTRQATTLLTGGWGTYARSKKKALAKLFFDFWLNSESQLIWSRNTLSPPVLRHVAKQASEMGNKPPSWLMFEEMMPYATHLSDIISPHELQWFMNQLNPLWSGIETPKHACERIQESYPKQWAIAAAKATLDKK